jgi:hypothetical protein
MSGCEGQVSGWREMMMYVDAPGRIAGFLGSRLGPRDQRARAQSRDSSEQIAPGRVIFTSAGN